MQKSYDLTKFRKDITKSIKGIAAGFNDPEDWISTGNYALNYLISEDFYKGVPLSKITTFAGEPGSGKSLLASGSIVRNAQEKGIYTVLIDSENALDESWLKAAGVDTDEDKLLRLGINAIGDVGKTISELVKGYKDQYGHLPIEEQPKVLIVIDSLGMLLTTTDIDQYTKGDMKGDMGRKAKALIALVRNVINDISPHNIGVVATNHTYASQDMFDPEDKVAGGSGFVYASSIVVALKKRKLKEDESGNKTSSVTGIRAAAKVMKSRFSKPFESIEVKIPYDTGIDPYSGLFEMFEKMGILEKQGNRYKYVSKKTGEEILEFRKKWTAPLLDQVMDEFHLNNDGNNEDNKDDVEQEEKGGDE